ncbi:hypothetical protein BASA81_007919 [Batrachochytrium salamandrivorans]|nr:hypothetical protein BASA81_007919 [Batrachochytrium salamandrivorans]
MQDVPAEFLPSLPQNRQGRGGSVINDARGEAMRAHMQQRPLSTSRSGSVVSQSQRPTSQRPTSVSLQQQQQMLDFQQRARASSASSSFSALPLAVAVRSERSDSVSSSSSLPRNRNSVVNNSNESRNSMDRPQSSIPIALAQLETVNPAFAKRFAGDRTTLTLNDSQLGERLHTQLGGEIITAEVVQQQVTDRRQALTALDDEIAALERELAEANRNDYGEDEWMNHMQQDDKPYMRPHSYKPKCSLVIFIITLAFMAAEIGFNGGVEDISFNPLLGPSNTVLLMLGAKRTDLIVDNGEWARLFMPIVLHVGILHFLVNMLALYSIGIPMEREYGSIKFGFIYVCSGCFGVLVSCLFVPKLMSVGASGAIFGLFGAALAELIQNWALYRGSQCINLFQLLFMIGLNIGIGIMPYLDNFAHIGGLVCGFIMGLLLLVQTRYLYTGQKQSKRYYQLALMACSFVVFPTLMAAGYGVLFTLGPVNCNWCQVISCVPFPPGAPPAEQWWSCD